MLLGDYGSEDLPAEVHALRIFEECTGSRKPQHVRAIGRLTIGGRGGGVVGDGGRGREREGWLGMGEGDGGG